MDIIDKAKDLGEAIKNSKEMVRLKRCEEQVHADSTAQALLSDMGLLRREMVKALQENRDRENIDMLKNLVIAKQEEVNNYEVTRNFIEAKEDFDALIKKINDIMKYAITGEVPSCSPDGGGCGGCSGCK